MKTRLLTLSMLVLALALSAGAAAALLAASPAQAARPAANDGPAMPTADFGIEEIITRTVLTLNISNEAPGYLIDSLIAQGHGDETLFELLGYLKAQSGGVISDTFYQDVANAPPGSEVFSAHLSNYAGLNGWSVEISADGFVHITGQRGSTYAGMPGYATAPSQDGRFTLTYAQDAGHYIYTGSTYDQSGPITYRYDYYAFAIAWSEGDTVYLPLVARNLIPCFEDDFSDPNSGWYVGDGSGWSIGYLNGEYQILLAENNYWAWGSPDRPLPSNYRIEFDARLITDNLGSYGLIFGIDAQEETGYSFLVFPTDQAYVIVRHNADGTFTLLEDEDHNPVINAGTATNRLRIDRIGSSIHAYVNGVLVATWDDGSFVGMGLTYGLVAYSYDEGAVDARFDNFAACPTALTSPLYVEDFSVGGRWYENDHGWAQWSYQGEEYEILIRNTDSWAYATVPLEGGLPRFAMEANMRFATTTLGSYGLNFDQVDEHHLYSFIVMPGSNQYGLWRFDTDTWIPLVPWTASAAINPGTATNHLRVERDGEQIRLYANGVLLTSLSDSSYVGNHEMSLYADSHGDVPVAARFDNFVFSELP